MRTSRSDYERLRAALVVPNVCPECGRHAEEGVCPAKNCPLAGAEKKKSQSEDKS